MNYEILVNRNNKIPDEEPSLVAFQTRVDLTLSDDKTLSIETKTYDMWLKLIGAAKEEGYDFEVISGYRTTEYQQKILEYYITELGFDTAIKRVALPNYSEHQTGLAIDFCYFREMEVYGEIISQETDNIKDDDKEFIWITSNMHKYGFILRYPADKVEITGYIYEPWHIRYVGIELAKYIYENHLTLEEHHQKKLHK
jgi:D-alanyl-D-alanine carboxypeptidase